MWHSRILGGHAIIPIRSRNWETYLSVVFVEWKDEIRRRLARRQQRPSDLGSVCGRFHTWVRRTRCRRMPDIVATTRHGTVGISIGTGVGGQRPARVSKQMQRDISIWHSRILGGLATIPIRSRNRETYLQVVFAEWKDEIRRRLARRQQRPSDLGS